MMYQITTREEYDYAVARGYEPLLGGCLEMEHGLRLAIQQEKFGTGHRRRTSGSIGGAGSTCRTSARNACAR